MKTTPKMLATPPEETNASSSQWIFLAIQFLLRYIKYCFLTGTVILVFTALVFIATNLGMTVSFGFLKYFSFLNPSFGKETWTGGITELMQIFSILALAVFLISSIIKFILRKLFDFEHSVLFKTKIIATFSLITLSYLADFLIVGFSADLSPGFYAILLTFYAINLICAGGYFIMDYLIRTLSMFNPRRQI